MSNPKYRGVHNHHHLRDYPMIILLTIKITDITKEN